MKIPKYGFRIKLNHQFPERWTQYLKVRWNQIWHLVTLGIRYVIYWIYIRVKGRTPLMDYLDVRTSLQMYGVPLGGLGSGTIGRGFRGEFCRYQLRPGIYNYGIIYGNQFIVTILNKEGVCVYQKVLCTTKPPKNLKCWDWTFPGNNAEYLGLYPRSWTKFDIPEQNVSLTCRQISPVIPNDYQDSCLPCGVFVWHIENNSSEEKTISITFTFQNGIGEKSDSSPGATTESFQVDDELNGETVRGMLIRHTAGDMPYTFAIGALLEDDANVTVLPNWNPSGSGSEVWNPLKEKGCFNESFDNLQKKQSSKIGVGVCVQSKIQGKGSQSTKFSLSWDMPRVHFDEGGRHYHKYYTRFFGKDGNAAAKIAKHALMTYRQWEDAIDRWQNVVLEDGSLPDWYKSALFNETYYVSDGGSVWLEIEDSEKNALSENDPRREYGRFAYLEGHEYRMYNTYDVHFYASFALTMNWPNLQKVIQRDFFDSVSAENKSRQWHLFGGDITERKKKNSIPHDLGDPGEEPFIKINSYPIHDVSEWRDLDLKYVLQCFRDYYITEDMEELRYHWPNMKLLMKCALRWDIDGDGLIENHGCPDQTYDTWTMNGSSAYCGSLWLGALAVSARTAELLNDPDFEELNERLCAAKSAFEKKLWNGQYYNFDCSRGSRARSIMSDQLCGLWYILCSGLPNEIIPNENALSALRTIYDFNVKKFNNGTCGAVNGMKPDGSIDASTIQSEEVWTGVVYAVASLFLYHNMIDEAFATAEGVYKLVYDKIGLGFETPEAFYEKGCYRSIGYMRPLSIWSIQLAWEMMNKQKNL